VEATLPFNSPEEKKLVFTQAKEGDSVAVNFLMRTYHLVVWTHEEINALNLLLDNDSLNGITLHYRRLREESERCNRFKNLPNKGKGKRK